MATLTPLFNTSLSLNAGQRHDIQPGCESDKRARQRACFYSCKTGISAIHGGQDCARPARGVSPLYEDKGTGIFHKSLNKNLWDSCAVFPAFLRLLAVNQRHNPLFTFTRY